MTHELNMIEYLDWLEDQQDSKIITLANVFVIKNFNKSQPMLGDFVPTNEKGEVMEDMFCYERKFDCHEQCTDCKNKSSQFQQAIPRVLWKGWELDWSNDKEDRVSQKNGTFVVFDFYDTTHKTY